MKQKIIDPANIITCSRMLLSVALLFSDAFSSAFYVLYLLAGFSDMIDGTVARKTGTESKFGERLDTAADMIFVAAAAFKMLPQMDIPGWIVIWAGIIAIIIRVVPLNYSSIIICLVASFAAVQEGHYIRTDHSVKKNVSENS